MRDNRWAVLAGLRFVLAVVVVAFHSITYGEPGW